MNEIGSRHRFRLSSGNAEPSYFMSGTGELKYRLHSAFIAQLMQGNDCVSLEVLHHTHGWRKVCDTDHSFIMINNPLTLDYGRLCGAIIHTLAECDSWPSEEEKRIKNNLRQAKNREEIALARRGRFYILP